MESSDFNEAWAAAAASKMGNCSEASAGASEAISDNPGSGRSSCRERVQQLARQLVEERRKRHSEIEAVLQADGLSTPAGRLANSHSATMPAGDSSLGELDALAHVDSEAPSVGASDCDGSLVAAVANDCVSSLEKAAAAQRETQQMLASLLPHLEDRCEPMAVEDARAEFDSLWSFTRELQKRLLVTQAAVEARFEQAPLPTVRQEDLRIQNGEHAYVAHLIARADERLEAYCAALYREQAEILSKKLDSWFADRRSMDACAKIQHHARRLAAIEKYIGLAVDDGGCDSATASSATSPAGDQADGAINGVGVADVAAGAIASGACPVGTYHVGDEDDVGSTGLGNVVAVQRLSERLQRLEGSVGRLLVTVGQPPGPLQMGQRIARPSEASQPDLLTITAGPPVLGPSTATHHNAGSIAQRPRSPSPVWGRAQLPARSSSPIIAATAATAVVCGPSSEVSIASSPHGSVNAAWVAARQPSGAFPRMGSPLRAVSVPAPDGFLGGQHCAVLGPSAACRRQQTPVAAVATAVPVGTVGCSGIANVAGFSGPLVSTTVRQVTRTSPSPEARRHSPSPPPLPTRSRCGNVGQTTSAPPWQWSRQPL